MLDDAPPRLRALIGLSIPLVAALVWPRPGAPPAKVTVHVTTPLAPGLTAMPAGSRPSCPPPRRDAPWVSPDLPESVHRMQPAPTNAGWIVAWNDDHVFVSYDAGATFTRVLDGDGDSIVLDASFDCYGRLVVLRGDEVGIRDGTVERWHAVPRLHDEDARGTTTRVVLGGGPDIVVLGGSLTGPYEARVAISSDAAASWRYVDVDAKPDLAHGQQHPDGTIDAVVTTTLRAGDHLTWATIRGEDVTTRAASISESATSEIYGDRLLVDDFWMRRDGERNDRTLPPEASRLAPLPGPYPVLEGDDKAYRLVDGQLRELPVTLDGAPEAVDLAGRIWTIACGRLLVAQRTSAHAADACD